MADQGYMMAWGDPNGGVTFQLTTAAFQKLSRSDTWRWVTQERFNNDPAEQYIGRGSKTIQMQGVIFTSYNPGAGVPGALTTAVGTHQLDKIRLLADQGSPKTLIDGRGNVLGNWVLVGMKEDQEYFLVNGAPQKQTFSLEFRSYGDDATNAEAQFKGKPPVEVTADNAVQLVLQNNGMSSDQAELANTITNDLVQDNPGMAPYATQMAVLVGGTWGLTGNAFGEAMQALTDQLAINDFRDAQSVLSYGMLALNESLAKFGSQNGDAALNALTVLSLVPGAVADRGDYLAKLSTSLDGLASNAYMQASGVNSVPKNPAVSVLGETLAAIDALRGSDPSFANSYSQSSNQQLMDSVRSYSTGQFNQEQGNLALAGVGQEAAPTQPDPADTAANLDTPDPVPYSAPNPEEVN